MEISRLQCVHNAQQWGHIVSTIIGPIDLLLGWTPTQAMQPIAALKAGSLMHPCGVYKHRACIIIMQGPALTCLPARFSSEYADATNAMQYVHWYTHNVTGSSSVLNWHSYWRAVSTKRKPFDQPSSGHQQRTDVKAGLLRCMASEMTVTRHRVGMVAWFNVPPNLLQSDHSPDNVKFPDGSRHSCPCQVLSCPY